LILPLQRFLATALLALAAWPACGEEFKDFDTRGLPGAQGVVVRVRHPAPWQEVPADDAQVLAEFRGPQDGLTGILQIGRGQRRDDIATLCQPERARTMLQDAHEPGTRVTDVFARRLDGRPAYEIRYERHEAPTFLVVRSLVVCLKDTRVVVSCGGAGERKAGLSAIEPVCRQVLDSLSVSEE